MIQWSSDDWSSEEFFRFCFRIRQVEFTKFVESKLGRTLSRSELQPYIRLYRNMMASICDAAVAQGLDSYTWHDDQFDPSDVQLMREFWEHMLVKLEAIDLHNPLSFNGHGVEPIILPEDLMPPEDSIPFPAVYDDVEFYDDDDDDYDDDKDSEYVCRLL